jgi:hypothetical protein
MATKIGTNGDDTINGGAGGDILIGGGGNDVLKGKGGDDILLGGAGSDVLYGGAGNDILEGGAGSDVLDGGIGDDVLDGGAGNDILIGGAGNDIIDGGTGNDVIEGDGGNDIIRGGAGNDTVIFSGNRSDYTITFDNANNYFIVTDTRNGSPDGVDKVYADVETLKFADEAVAICFMPGTMVLTPGGEVAVETLRRGDLVTVTDGRSVPVSWLGRQTCSTVFGDPLRILPIRIKAGALGDNVPCRDLLVSPDHALLVEGALIHAGALVNGSSIVRESDVPRVFTYYHVEVDDHSLILAENTPAETFVDNVDRLAFDNWAEHEELYPEGKPISELPYPRAKAHRQVPVSTRVKLAERARLIGALVEQTSAA